MTNSLKNIKATVFTLLEKQKRYLIYCKTWSSTFSNDQRKKNKLWYTLKYFTNMILPETQEISTTSEETGTVGLTG